MIWGFPAAFYFAAVALPVAAAFFYKRFAKLHEVPALQHWMELGRSVEVHSFSSWLRRLLALLIQLLLISVLVLALADPSPHRKVQRTVIVLDVGATMQTHDAAGGDRMSAAKTEAEKFLSALDPDSQVALLQAGQCPILLVSPTRDFNKIRQAIDVTQSLDVESDLNATLQATKAFVTSDAPTDVAFFSDFAGCNLKDVRKSWQSTAKLLLIPVGMDVPDAAITNLWSEFDQHGRRVSARIEQKGMTGQRIMVQLVVNGHAMTSKEVTLQNGATTAELSASIPAGAAFEVSMHGNDALSADDHAYGILAPGEQFSICLVTLGNLPLQRALAADPSVKVHVVSPLSFTSSFHDEVVIVDGVNIPHDSHPGTRGWLYIGTADPFGWAKAHGTAACGAVTHWCGDHPLVAELDPALIKVKQACSYVWNPAVKITEIVSADNIPLIAEATVPVSDPAGGTARHVYWLFDLKQTDLTRRLTFPILLWNTVEYLATGATEDQTVPRFTGLPLKLYRTNPAIPPVVEGPDGHRISVKTNSDVDLILDTTRQGIYLQDGQPAFALNLFSSRGLKALPASEDVANQKEGSVTGASTWESFLPKPLRNALLILVIFLAMLEWLLFHRRIIKIG